MYAAQLFAPFRVCSGAIFLDWNRPGWEKDIDLSKLNLADAEQCVLGQLCGDYNKGLNDLKIEPEAVARGFAASNRERQDEEYSLLNSLWRRQVKWRLRWSS